MFVSKLFLQKVDREHVTGLNFRFLIFFLGMKVLELEIESSFNK